VNPENARLPRPDVACITTGWCSCESRRPRHCCNLGASFHGFAHLRHSRRKAAQPRGPAWPSSATARPDDAPHSRYRQVEYDIPAVLRVWNNHATVRFATCSSACRKSWTTRSERKDRRALQPGLHDVARSFGVESARVRAPATSKACSKPHPRPTGPIWSSSRRSRNPAGGTGTWSLPPRRTRSELQEIGGARRQKS